MERLLCIDQGNTHAKIGYFEDAELKDLQVFPSHLLSDSRNALVDFSFDYWIISSVGDPSSIASTLIERSPGIILSEDTKLPFTSAYTTMGTVGRDRLAALAGAKALYPGKNLLVIDAGTCITYDVINKNGVYLGGLIIPGIDMRYRSMHEFTHRLPRVFVPDDLIDIGDSTTSCMQAGGLFGVMAEYEGIFDRYRKRYKISHVIVTGGDSRWFAKLGKREIFVHRDLVLVGLQQILSLNVLGNR